MKRTLLSIILALTMLIVAFGQDPVDKERVYSVPDINGRAMLLIQPEISSDLSLKADSKTLIVKVVVDANGNVVSAKCSQECPKAITDPAEAAAMASKFRPLIIGGRAVKYDGTLMYTIALEKVYWYRFATALQSTYIFDNLSLEPVAAMLTSEFAEERSKLQNLDQGGELAFRWKTIEGVKDSIRRKLQGKDVWWFDLGFAMREVTSQFQSDKKLNLSEVQSAISNLTKFVETAPSSVPKPTVENLRTLSTYKIDSVMPPQKVHQEIFKLASDSFELKTNAGMCSPPSRIFATVFEKDPNVFLLKLKGKQKKIRETVYGYLCVVSPSADKITNKKDLIPPSSPAFTTAQEMREFMKQNKLCNKRK